MLSAHRLSNQHDISWVCIPRHFSQRVVTLTNTYVGQVLRDMRRLGVRFGIISTYKYTVFPDCVDMVDCLRARSARQPRRFAVAVVRQTEEVLRCYANLIRTSPRTRASINPSFHSDMSHWRSTPKRVLRIDSLLFRCLVSSIRDTEDGQPHAVHHPGFLF
jgi:hypothetical protein